ncbi:hypothetical protein SS50377_25131 [Spironucleus salmonicida]|uniref:Uncharacterized protein n=1 Tax=Spironucleus salmonicida TaxID=348837 RepID=V6LJJ1_9EUKA|nr:hypothetical protein SS50377_25131 [Spironucleus salmonicida]|eukprot:EST44687.1 Hypothetical protein SS50377_15396 [Spironucleus salmonicida]
MFTVIQEKYKKILNFPPKSQKPITKQVQNNSYCQNLKIQRENSITLKTTSFQSIPSSANSLKRANSFDNTAFKPSKLHRNLSLQPQQLHFYTNNLQRYIPSEPPTDKLAEYQSLSASYFTAKSNGQFGMRQINYFFQKCKRTSRGTVIDQVFNDEKESRESIILPVSQVLRKHGREQMRQRFERVKWICE